MDAKIGIILLAVLVLLLAFLALLFGCVSQEQQPPASPGSPPLQQGSMMAGQNNNSSSFQPGAGYPSGYGPGAGYANRSRGNLTAEQRQMLQERMSQAISACSGKAQGDACAFASPRGTMNGNCRLGQNNTLSCGFAARNGRPAGQPSAGS